MTFEEYWPTACLPGEYDSMDSCDQGRWRGVAQAAWQAGRDSMKDKCVKVCEKWHDSLASEPEMLEIAKKIKELK